MLKLYSMDFNSAGQRVRTALYLKEVPFEYISVRDIGWDAYRQINPQGLMPTLDIDGELIPQSTAIFEYIEETYPDPPLLPADPIERARVRAFSQFIGSDMHPIHVGRVRRYLTSEFGATEGQIQAWYCHWMSVGLTALEEMLRRRPRNGDFCFGDRPMMADLYLVPQVMNGRRHKCDMSSFPLITAIDEACRALPAFQAGMPERQPDHPE